jgi:hypothetical protein
VGAGVLGAIAGGGFAWLSMTYHDEAVSHCAGKACDPTGVSLRDEAVRDGDIATAALAIGGVAVLAGAILWATAPSRKAQATARFGAIAGSHATEVVLQGAW